MQDDRDRAHDLAEETDKAAAERFIGKDKGTPAVDRKDRDEGEPATGRKSQS